MQAIISTEVYSDQIEAARNVAISSTISCIVDTPKNAINSYCAKPTTKESSYLHMCIRACRLILIAAVKIVSIRAADQVITSRRLHGNPSSAGSTLAKFLR